jgi:hypothetical protein
MPAVDLARLSREIDQMLGPAQDPAALARAALDLLERYAERPRRKPGRLEDSLNAPRPVMDALGHALASEGVASGQILALADALWSLPLRETRLLALDVMHACDVPEVADRAERCASDTADPQILEEVARRGLATWGQKDRPQAFRCAGRWLVAGNPRVRELALAFLLAIVEDGGSEDLRGVINLLSACPELGRGPERRSLARLLLSLVRRAPAEGSRLLLDGVRQGNQPIVQIARQALPLLPPSQRKALENALAASGPSGIMPRSE